jgi:hypothetical protein
MIYIIDISGIWSGILDRYGTHIASNTRTTSNYLTPGAAMSWNRFIPERHFLETNSPISHPDETTHTHGCVELPPSLWNTSRALDVKSYYLFPRNAAPEMVPPFRKYVSELSSAMYTDSNNN